MRLLWNTFPTHVSSFKPSLQTTFRLCKCQHPENVQICQPKHAFILRGMSTNLCAWILKTKKCCFVEIALNGILKFICSKIDLLAHMPKIEALMCKFKHFAQICVDNLHQHKFSLMQKITAHLKSTKMRQMANLHIFRMLPVNINSLILLGCNPELERTPHVSILRRHHATIQQLLLLTSRKDLVVTIVQQESMK